LLTLATSYFELADISTLVAADFGFDSWKNRPHHQPLRSRFMRRGSRLIPAEMIIPPLNESLTIERSYQPPHTLELDKLEYFAVRAGLNRVSL